MQQIKKTPNTKFTSTHVNRMQIHNQNSKYTYIQTINKKTQHIQSRITQQSNKTYHVKHHRSKKAKNQ